MMHAGSTPPPAHAVPLHTIITQLHFCFGLPAGNGDKVHSTCSICLWQAWRHMSPGCPAPLQERRLKRLETSLARLRAACQELGEDEKFAAAGVCCL
jgi:hypothetical protein